MKKLYTVLAAALAVAMGASAASPLKSLDKVNIKRDFTVKTELSSALKADDSKSLIRKAAKAKAAEGLTAEDITSDYLCSAYSQATNPETNSAYGWDNLGVATIYPTSATDITINGLLGLGSEANFTGSFSSADASITVPGKQIATVLIPKEEQTPGATEPEYDEIYMKLYVSRVKWDATTINDQLVETDEPIVFNYNAKNHRYSYECETSADGKRIVTLLIMERVNKDGSHIVTPTGSYSFFDMLAMVDLDAINGIINFEALDATASTAGNIVFKEEGAYIYGEVTGNNKFLVKNLYDYGFGVSVEFDITSDKKISAKDVLLVELKEQGKVISFYLSATNDVTGEIDEEAPIEFQGSSEVINTEFGQSTITMFSNSQLLVDLDTSMQYRLLWEMIQNTQMIFFYDVFSSAGVEDVTVADENAPVEYFNLQGVRVENPEAGLYIRRQGNTATKVLVK